MIWIFYLFTPQKFWFWGFEPLNVNGHHRDPEKAHHWPEPHLRANFGADRSTGATWARAEGIKKRKKGKERNLQWQTGCPHRPPTLTQRYVVLHAGWTSGGSYKFKVSSKSVERFSRCGVEICHFLYLRPVAYITACTVLLYKLWWVRMPLFAPLLIVFHYTYPNDTKFLRKKITLWTIKRWQYIILWS